MTLYTEQSQDTSDTYPTKPELWRPIADAIGGFDIDPAAGCEPEQIATTTYTKEDDGLQQEWNGNVWLNPPFSEKLAFYRKAVNEYQCGNADVIVALSPSDTSTEWFQRWFSQADVLCFLEGRDWYMKGGSPSFNTVVGVFGECSDELVSILDRKGCVVEQIQTGKQGTLPGVEP